jgi:hypothetical protein
MGIQNDDQHKKNEFNTHGAGVRVRLKKQMNTKLKHLRELLILCPSIRQHQYILARKIDNNIR